jgi:mannose/cellobiose epimerase-like protein (N-acyl-D-glucosamine 2-epimerase family)
VTLVDRAERPIGSRDKDLRRQARMTWMLAAAHRHGLTGRGYLELAARGVAFLTTRMWDARDGGFVARVAPDGRPTAYWLDLGPDLNDIPRRVRRIVVADVRAQPGPTAECP